MTQNSGALSPDGRWLAYTTTEASYLVAGSADIFVQPFPKTGAKYAITRGAEQMGGAIPHWSPDGKTVFYRRPTIGDQVFAVDIKTDSGFAFSNERALNVRGFSMVQFFRDYDITRDGRFVMLFPADVKAGRDAAPLQIHFVLNWFEELKRLVPTN